MPHRPACLDTALRSVVITSNLREGALELNLPCKLNLRLTFLVQNIHQHNFYNLNCSSSYCGYCAQVTGVRNGGCKYYDTCYFAEIAALFHNTAHTQVNFRTLARCLSAV